MSAKTRTSKKDLDSGGLFDHPPLRKGDKKGQIGKEHIDPVLYRDYDPDFYILSENHIAPYFIRTQLKPFIQQLTGDSSVGISVISTLPFKASPTAIQKSPVGYYKKNGVDLTKYIPPHSKVLSMGRAINHITQGDILVNHLYDVVTNYTYFYSPHIKSYVFPVDMFFSWIDDKGWKQYYARHQIKKIHEFEIPKTREPKLKKETVEDVRQFIADHKNDPKVAIDTETDSLDYFEANIGCVTMSFDGRTGYYIPWGKIEPVKSEFSEFLSHKYQIYQNGQYDTKVLRSNGIKHEHLHIDYDTLHGGHVLNELSPNSLKSQVWIYTRHGGYDWPLEDYKKKYPKLKNYLNIPFDILFPYAVMDAIVTYQLYDAQQNHLDWVDRNFPPERDKGLHQVEIQHTLREYLENYVIPAVNAFNDIEWDGMHINVDELRKQGKYFSKEARRLETEIRKKFSIPDNLNMDSHSELGKHIESLGYPIEERGDGGIPLINDEALSEWEKKGYTEFSLIHEYRQKTWFINTFFGDEKEDKGYWKLIRHHPEDGSYRVHSSIAAFLMKTGRNGSKNPNLMNIPKRGGDDAKRVRKIFSPPSPDYYIMEADGAGYQLRIGAALSGDPQMKRAFLDPKIKGDLHSVTAQGVLKRDITLEEFLDLKKKGDPEIKNKRYKGKQANFSLEFGSTGFAFASETLLKEWPLKEVEEYLKEFEIEDNAKRLKSMADKNDDVKSNPKGKSSVDVTMEFAKYWAVANDFRKKFFEQYPGLKKWIDTGGIFARSRGYARSVHGAFRRLPQLLSYNESEPSELKTYLNQSVNSPVQNFENTVMSGKLITTLRKYCSSPNVKSRVANMVHDSVVLYIHKDEIHDILKIAREIFEAEVPENNEVPMELEAEVADYFGKGEVWGEGTEY